MGTFDLLEVQRLAGIVAGRLCRNKAHRNFFDDVRQEALIGGWRCLQSHPDASEAYLMASMRNAALSFVVEGTVTGGGRASDGTLAMRRAEVPEVDDLGNSRFAEIEHVPRDPGFGPRWALLMSGLDATKREIADLMFANGFTATEAAELMGLSVPTVGAHRARLTRHIRAHFTPA